VFSFEVEQGVLLRIGTHVSISCHFTHLVKVGPCYNLDQVFPLKLQEERGKPQHFTLLLEPNTRAQLHHGVIHLLGARRIRDEPAFLTHATRFGEIPFHQTSIVTVEQLKRFPWIWVTIRAGIINAQLLKHLQPKHNLS